MPGRNNSSDDESFAEAERSLKKAAKIVEELTKMEIKPKQTKSKKVSKKKSKDSNAKAPPTAPRISSFFDLKKKGSLGFELNKIFTNFQKYKNLEQEHKDSFEENIDKFIDKMKKTITDEADEKIKIEEEDAMVRYDDFLEEFIKKANVIVNQRITMAPKTSQTALKSLKEIFDKKITDCKRELKSTRYKKARDHFDSQKHSKGTL